MLALRSTGKRQLPPRDAVCGLLVEGLVELGEFSGACLQELLARRKGVNDIARPMKQSSSFQVCILQGLQLTQDV